jgi:hypothetical protein
LSGRSGSSGSAASSGSSGSSGTSGRSGSSASSGSSGSSGTSGRSGSSASSGSSGTSGSSGLAASAGISGNLFAFYPFTGVYASSSNTIQSTNLIYYDIPNTEIGIGPGVFTTASAGPTALLHVSGASNFPLFRVGSPANSNILFVTGSGRVGIVTTNPVDTLHVVGDGRFEGSLDLGHGSAGEYSLEIGQGRTGNGFAYIDLVGDTTYPDYGLRIIRGNGGANTTSTIETRGTGDFRFLTNEAAPIIFLTTGTERARVAAGGNFGVGTNNPTSKLTVETAGAVDGIALNGSNNFVFTILESGTTRGYSPAFPTTAGAFSTDAAARDFVYRVEAATQRFLFNTNGGTGGSTLAITGSRVGITKVNPTGSFHINSAEQIALQIDSTTANNLLFVSSSGQIGIGLGASPSLLNHKLVVFSGSIALRGPNDAAFSFRLNDTGSTNRNALFVSSSNYLALGNINYTGLELFHTGSTPTENAGDPSSITAYYGTDPRVYLAEPDKWLAIRLNNVRYVVPMYIQA